MKALSRFLCALVVPLAACGAAGEATPPAPAPDASEPDLVISARTADGSRIEGQIGGDVQRPAKFPDDVPVYPEAWLTASGSASGEGVFLLLGSSDEPRTIYRFYQDSLAAAGWSFDTELWLGGVGILSATKGERVASVSVTGGADETVITLTIKVADPS
ncbi:MAG: hypothetical protein VX614_06305 [Myxococcota bacterium]|nr:hypothetical protein [Myxococcota bacterium]